VSFDKIELEVGLHNYVTFHP